MSEDEAGPPEGWLDVDGVPIPPKPTTMPFDMTEQEWIEYYYLHCKEDQMVPPLPLGDKRCWYEHAMECVAKNAPRYLHRYFQWERFGPGPEASESSEDSSSDEEAEARGPSGLRSKLSSTHGPLLSTRLLRSDLKPRAVNSEPGPNLKPNLNSNLKPAVKPGKPGPKLKQGRKRGRKPGQSSKADKFMPWKPIDVLGNQKRLRELRAWARERRSNS